MKSANKQSTRSETICRIEEMTNDPRSSVSDDSIPEATAETPRSSKLKLNFALKVFRFFQFSCNVEATSTDDETDDD